MTVSKYGSTKDVLSDVYGEVPEKEITAIMGPSGCGKTTLLNILSGRMTTKGPVTVTSDIRLNDFKVKPTALEIRQQIAFVAQDDSLQITSTPRESIRFSAKLRLPRSITDQELDELTERMLQELGLVKCADTIVGGPLLKGISGGERKRTSVGVELVVKPALIFLDEPTSGLDSYSAMQLIKVLKKVAKAGSSVLFTIHQPSSDVFNSFDRILLMNNGRVMATGQVEQLYTFFQERGKPVPNHYNPADWLMDVAQTVPMDQLLKAGFFPKDSRPATQALDASSYSNVDVLGVSITETGDKDSRRVTFYTQVSMLLYREWRNILRNKKALAARFLFTIMMSFLLGIIFWKIGDRSLASFPNLQSHFGGMIMVLMLVMFGTAQPSLLAFPEERPVFLREYSTDHYVVGAYFVSRLVLEAVITCLQVMLASIIGYFFLSLTMNFFYFFAIVYVLAMTSTAVAVLLGCSVGDPKMGQEFLPVLFVPQLLFAGFYVPPGFIPAWLRWVQYVCSLTYAVRLALEAEFGECADNPSFNPNFCETLLQASNVYQIPIYGYWLILIALFVFFRVSALLVLKKKAMSFF